MAYKNGERRNFSEEVKKAAVKEIESGRSTLSETSRHFGADKSTVRSWLQIYGKFKPKLNVVEVVMLDQREKIREMEKALAEAHLKVRIYEKIVEKAGEYYKTDLKKTFGTVASESSKKKGKRKLE